MDRRRSRKQHWIRSWTLFVAVVDDDDDDEVTDEFRGNENSVLKNDNKTKKTHKLVPILDN